MASFRDVQNLILFSHGVNFIDDEEFLNLYDLFEPRNPDFPFPVDDDVKLVLLASSTRTRRRDFMVALAH